MVKTTKHLTDKFITGQDFTDIDTDSLLETESKTGYLFLGERGQHTPPNISEIMGEDDPNPTQGYMFLNLR